MISSRSFSAPLFGSTSATTFHIFGHQLLSNGLEVSAFASGGFPSTATYAGAEVDRLRLGRGLATVDAGDFSAARLEPEGAPPIGNDTFTLEGLQFRWRDASDRGFAFFAGRSKFSLALPGEAARKPDVAGAEYIFRVDRNYFDSAIQLVDNPVYVDPSIHRNSDALLRTSYFRRISPIALVFADAYGSRGAGARAGFAYQGQLGSASMSVYSFSREMPLVSSFNPGERGLQTSAFYRPTDLSALAMQLYYVASDVTTRRKDLRGQVSFQKSFGSGAPYIYAAYSRQQLVANTLVENVSRLADTYTLLVSRATLAGYATLQLDHVITHDASSPDLTQLLGDYQRVIGGSSFLNATLVAQAQQGRWGATLDSAIETPLRQPYYALAGIGAAVVSDGTSTGEGILRLGISRRVLSNGTYGRVEVRLPVRIGLARSHLNRSTALLDLGTRFSWQDLRSARAALAPILTPSQFGTVEGTVTYNGRGVAGVIITVNGEEVAQTDAAGKYRVRRIAAGPATIAVDVTRLEPGLSVSGAPSRDVIIEPRGLTTADFTLARLTLLQGSVVMCRDGRPYGVPGARFALVRGDTLIPLQTSSSGSFQADNIPPDEYDLVFDPTSLPGIAPSEVPKVKIDLRHDVLGFLIRLRCEE